MGFSTFNTLLLGGLSYIFQAFLVLLATGGSSYLRNSRTYWMIWNFAIAILGILLLRQLPHSMRWGRFIGKCLGGSFTANFPMVMAMISSNIGGFTKKTSVNAMVFNFPNLPLLGSPWTDLICNSRFLWHIALATSSARTSSSTTRHPTIILASCLC